MNNTQFIWKNHTFYNAKPHFCMGKTYDLIKMFFIYENSANVDFCKNIIVKLAKMFLF